MKIQMTLEFKVPPPRSHFPRKQRHPNPLILSSSYRAPQKLPPLRLSQNQKRANSVISLSALSTIPTLIWLEVLTTGLRHPLKIIRFLTKVSLWIKISTTNCLNKILRKEMLSPWISPLKCSHNPIYADNYLFWQMPILINLDAFFLDHDVQIIEEGSILMMNLFALYYNITEW